MATGTGKTYTAFQIIWRLWKAGVKKRILFLADRNILVDQTKTNDFKPFGGAMTKITNRKVDKSFEIYLAMYQAITGTEEAAGHIQAVLARFLRPHRRRRMPPRQRRRRFGLASRSWTTSASATQIGSHRHAQGDDGHLHQPLLRRAGLHLLAQAGHRGRLPRPLQGRSHRPRQGPHGWRPEKGKMDKYGDEIEDRMYNQKDFDRTLVLEKRTELVATQSDRVSQGHGPLRQDHRVLRRHRPRRTHAPGPGQRRTPSCAPSNRKYVMRITGDNDEGKARAGQLHQPRASVIRSSSRHRS